MNRFLAIMLSMTWLAAMPLAAQADERDAPGQDGPIVVCVGDAPAPSVLRFAFQAEPAQRFRPEVLRTATRRRAAPTPAAPASVIYLPCING